MARANGLGGQSTQQQKLCRDLRNPRPKSKLLSSVFQSLGLDFSPYKAFLSFSALLSFMERPLGAFKYASLPILSFKMTDRTSRRFLFKFLGKA